MPVNPRYIPKPVPGFVWLSNYSRERYPQREDVIVAISTDFDLPIEDIYVEPFEAVGGWAGFIREKHQAVAANLAQMVAEGIGLLRILAQLEEEGL